MSSKLILGCFRFSVFLLYSSGFSYHFSGRFITHAHRVRPNRQVSTYTGAPVTVAIIIIALDGFASHTVSLFAHTSQGSSDCLPLPGIPRPLGPSLPQAALDHI